MEIKDRKLFESVQEEVRLLSNVREQLLALLEIADAAKIIFDVTSNASRRGKEVFCPHGNLPTYPTHAWWCDECFMRLEEALRKVYGNED